MRRIHRRNFMKTSAATVLAGASGLATADSSQSGAGANGASGAPKYRLGMVTYNMGKDMDVDALITFCRETGLEGVELRTTHKHGVETTLSAAERELVRKKFQDGGVVIAGLGSTFEFHSRDSDEVRKNVEGSKEYAKLAADVGALGIKVRPNSLYEDEPVDQTCERIGKAWGEVAAYAADLGIEVRMEVHGSKGSALPVNVRKMLDAANHRNALVCWNSNKTDQDEAGSIKTSFGLLKHAIGEVHITDIGIYQYPWQELFRELTAADYSGFCLAEIAFNPEPERFMKYYRTLFDLYSGQYHYPR